EEHTSELQSLTNLVCRLLLEKKKTPAISRCVQPIVQSRTGCRSLLRHAAARSGLACITASFSSDDVSRIIAEGHQRTTIVDTGPTATGASTHVEGYGCSTDGSGCTEAAQTVQEISGYGSSHRRG